MQLVKHILLAALALAWPQCTAAQRVGLFADPMATTTRVCVPVGVPVRTYLVFRQSASPGITGFEFRVLGLPTDWIAVSDHCGPVPCIGDLFGVGASWAWASCQLGELVPLAAVTFIALGQRADVTLAIGARVPPTNAGLNCPLVTRCDAPSFTGECVIGDQIVINNSELCPVATHQRSWSTVKALYQ